MLRQTVVLQRRPAKLFNDASKALHKRIHIFRLCLIHPHCVRCDFMAPIRAFTPCRAQGPCVHKSFKTVSQLLENPYLYFCLANAGSPSQFACYPKAVRTGAPPKIKHRTPPPCVRPGSPPGLKFSLRPARPNGPFPFPGDETKTALCNERSPQWRANADRNRATMSMQEIARIAAHSLQHTHRSARRHSEEAPWRKGVLKNCRKDAHSASLSQLHVADLRFLEELSTSGNQILNAVARMGA